MIMRLKYFYQQSKANQNYLIELFAFLPFLIMSISGLVMLKFHANENVFLLVLGISKSSWLLFHKTSSTVALVMVVWHLIQHAEWIKKLFTLKLKNKYKRLNTALFIVFTLTVFTAILSWILFLESSVEEGLRGIHSKLGFISIILFFFHIKNYSPSLKKMTIKMFSPKE